MNRTLTQLGLAATLIAGAPLNAQDSPSRPPLPPLNTQPKSRIGIQVSFVTPSGTSIDSKTKTSDGLPVFKATSFLGQGFGLGAIFEYDFDNNQAIRTKIEGLMFFEKTQDVQYIGYFVPFKSSIISVNVAADYLYAFDNHNKGLFIFAGGGLHNMSYKGKLNMREYQGAPIGEATGDSVGAALGLYAGFGYNFMRYLGFEIKYTHTLGFKFDGNLKYESSTFDTGTCDMNTAWVSLSLTCRF